MSSNKEKFFKGISIQSLITLTMGVLEVVVFALMSRILNKSEFGYFAAITGVVTVCTSVTEAGMGAAIIQKKNASQQFISTAFTLSWFLGIVGTFVVFFTAPVIAREIADENMILPLRVMSVNIFLACVSSVRRCILVKNLQFKRIGIYNVLAYTVSSFIGIFLAFCGAGLYSIIAISVLNLFIFNILLYSKRDNVPRFGLHSIYVREVFSFGGWLTISVIVNNITQQMDRLFLSRWLSVSALGSYNRPAGFVSNITSKINGIFDTVLFPMLSNVQDDAEKVKAVLMKAVKLLNSFSSVLAAIFFFNADLIVFIFFGEEWGNLVPILRIVAVYVIFNIDSRLVDCYFRSLALVKLGFQLRVVSAIVTFVLLFVGAKYDIWGVAVSLVAANVFTVVMKVFFLCKKVGASFETVFLSMIIACKPILILSVLGAINLLFFNENVWQWITFSLVFGVVIAVEFLCFPKLVGLEYQQTIYPSVKKKLLKRMA